MTTLTTERKTVDWSFWLRWTLATLVGLILFMGVAAVIGWGVGEVVMRTAGETVGVAVTGGIFGLAIGLGLGLPQTFVMRPYITRAERWALFSSISAWSLSSRS